MIRQVHSFFRRYAAAKSVLRAAPRTLRDGTGRAVGQIEVAQVTRGQLRVSGWTHARRITLRMDSAEATQASPADRAADAPLPFTLSLPFAPVPLPRSLPVQLVMDQGAPVTLVLRQPPAVQLRLQFAAAACRSLPALLRWIRHHDPKDRATIKRAFGLDARPTSGPLEPVVFAPVPASIPAPAEPADTPPKITLILPVYNALDMLREALDRVQRHTDLPWHLIVLEDCSTDARVRPFLRDWAAKHADTTTLIENPRNLGFVGTVNIGLAQALDAGGEGPVVLLNSDAFVPQGWASRLIAPMLHDPDVASVTPMSNHAEIFSVPVICAGQPLRAGQVDAIDATAARLSPDLPSPPMPTGVGFCMALSRRFLAQVPQFDTVFGRGYGEEVDWCRKTRALGGRHLAQPRLFVEHSGSESFSVDARRTLVIENGRIISERYPGYDAEVQEFITHDPLRSPRLALALAWAAGLNADGAPVPLYLAHAMGGGADKYLDQITAARARAGGASLVLRVGGPQRWQLDVVGPPGTTSGSTDDFDLVTALLAPVKHRHLVYSCGVGDPDPASLPAHLLALKTGEYDTLEVLFHDYFPLSPSYTLLDRNGIYHETAYRDPALAEWQARWGKLMEAADTITVFSTDSRHKVAQVWPGCAGRIHVTPHALLSQVPMLDPPATDATRVVAVLGNINHHKGAAVFCDLATLVGRRGALRLVLIGDIDPAFTPPRHVQVHGQYATRDIAALARHYGVTDWLIPSIWPETFSYTTHEALATGLPVFAFDIGAQGDEVRAAPNGRAIPYAADGNPAKSVLNALTRSRSGDPA